jgi:L-rhamnose mutarotase
VEIESEERWAQVKDTDVCKRWWAWMRDFIVFNDDGTPAARVLPELFFLP